MTYVLLSKIIFSAGFITALGFLLALLLIFAEKTILNYGICQIDINNGEKNLDVRGGSSLLSALSENNIFIPSACGGRGSCGYCKVQVNSGAGPLSPVEMPYLTETDIKNNIRLSCQVKVRGNINIIIPDELFSVKRFKGKLIHKRQLTHDILELKIGLINPGKIDFIAGQYIQLESEKYKGRESVSRAYSLSSVPSDNSSIELIIRKVPEGICTTWVFDILKEGDEVSLSGPYGQFRLSDTGSPILFIAGGSGMAPIWSMIKHMKETGNTRKATYVFGALSQKDLFFMEDLKRIENEMSNFTFIPALSNEPEGSGWNGETGLVPDVVMRNIPDLNGYEAYLCGSPGMINACVASLTENGVPEEKIFYDKFA